MSRRFWKIVLSAVFVAAAALYAYGWFTPDTPTELARTGRCEEYRRAGERLEAGLDSETAADPGEVEMVLAECERMGR
ncbi:hypothetical protein [Aureimonas jatrophae]|jgi:hypothetical protein|uniref:Uncharacterized protein n=1 Tax=Aureimonas jatrophae TaxID=1166073 RepID=A0A1H0F9Y7_9HYPH|nr:hypothetical protein [Aureimonas jatrophae]MBB3950116.1 hypothetical protein [Aureimonas jatrophae]SDN91289.1 hypothetical protein SAMN05192530_102420 [Aureimonas jatrophae]